MILKSYLLLKIISIFLHEKINNNITTIDKIFLILYIKKLIIT